MCVPKIRKGTTPGLPSSPSEILPLSSTNLVPQLYSGPSKVVCKFSPPRARVPDLTTLPSSILLPSHLAKFGWVFSRGCSPESFGYALPCPQSLVPLVFHSVTLVFASPHSFLNALSGLWSPFFPLFRFVERPVFATSSSFPSPIWTMCPREFPYPTNGSCFTPDLFFFVFEPLLFFN